MMQTVIKPQTHQLTQLGRENADLIVKAFPAVAKPRPTIEPKPVKPVSRGNKSTDLIVAATAEYFHVPRAELIGKNQFPTLAYPRHVAMYLMREIFSMTFQSCGEAFERDHTSARYGVGLTQRRLKRDAAFAAQVAALRSIIEEKNLTLA